MQSTGARTLDLTAQANALVTADSSWATRMGQHEWVAISHSKVVSLLGVSLMRPKHYMTGQLQVLEQLRGPLLKMSILEHLLHEACWKLCHEVQEHASCAQIVNELRPQSQNHCKNKIGWSF